MTRNDLIDRIAAKTQSTRAGAEQSLDAVLACLAEALESGEKVDLRGFGSFQAKGRAERQGRNPATGEAITIAARRAVVFKPGKELAGRVNDAPAAEISEGPAKVHGDKIDG
jgi:DNA-binding protein HU-beta